ncbi:MAG: hypothetical protein FAF05_01990 [Epsilonproteobacteria bacterium]|nr:hypothetical protein [Campylobacterota bacterium]
MKHDTFEKVIKFLLGASWGIILFGAFFVFNISIHFGLSIAIFLTLFFILLSLFLLLVLDAFLVNKQRVQELKKQTHLLEQILNSKS